MQKKPLIASAIQALSSDRDALHTIFKVRTYFRGLKFTVHLIGYREESDIPRSDMKGCTVF